MSVYSKEKAFQAQNKVYSPNEYRCFNCNKLLAKFSKENHSLATLEIKCERCGFLNSLTDDADDQVIITDSDGIILYANRQVELVTGYNMSEIIGQRPSLWGKQMLPKFYDELWRDIKKNKRSVVVHVTNRRKDGTFFKAILRISPLLDQNGSVKLFVGISTINKEKNGNSM